MDELFRLSGFGFTYPQQRRPALAGIDLTIRPGEFWVLCGPSGCGKSTLLRQLKTVLAPHGAAEGEVYFQGTPLRDVPLRQQAADIGFVLQSPEHQVVTDKLVELFGKEHPGYTRQDFYELELATSGMLRSFMARKCDRSFTMEQKLRRFLSCGMTIYGVDQEKQQEVIDRVLKMDLKSVADQLLAQAMAQSQEEFREAERKGKALEAARRG